MLSIKRTFFLWAVVILFVKCSSALYTPVVEDAAKTGIALETLQAGRGVYTAKCASCHALFLPQEYTMVQWQENVDEMEEKAGLNDEQKVLILNYLALACKPDQ